MVRMIGARRTAAGWPLTKRCEIARWSSSRHEMILISTAARCEIDRERCRPSRRPGEGEVLVACARALYLGPWIESDAIRGVQLFSFVHGMAVPFDSFVGRGITAYGRH